MDSRAAWSRHGFDASFGHRQSLVVAVRSHRVRHDAEAQAARAHGYCRARTPQAPRPRHDNRRRARGRLSGFSLRRRHEYSGTVPVSMRSPGARCGLPGGARTWRGRPPRPGSATRPCRGGFDGRCADAPPGWRPAWHPAPAPGHRAPRPGSCSSTRHQPPPRAGSPRPHSSARVTLTNSLRLRARLRPRPRSRSRLPGTGLSFVR